MRIRPASDRLTQMNDDLSFLAGEVGVRQFLDIGTGLPSANNVHEVAQRVAPHSRVLYADNDPLVLAHARALLTSAPAGRTAYIQADLREPEKILANPVLRETLDLSEPVALMLVAILHLVATHITAEHDPVGVGGMARAYRAGGVRVQPRTADEFGRMFFSGMELVPPGVVLISQWRPDGDSLQPAPAEVNGYAAVARK
jgi:hypothetical protein